jgi:hypothetical protein
MRQLFSQSFLRTIKATPNAQCSATPYRQPDASFICVGVFSFPCVFAVLGRRRAFIIRTDDASG